MTRTEAVRLLTERGCTGLTLDHIVLAYLMCPTCKLGVEASDTGHAIKGIGYCAKCRLVVDDYRCGMCGRYTKTLLPEHGFCPDCIYDNDTPDTAALMLWPECVECQDCAGYPNGECDVSIVKVSDVATCDADVCEPRGWL